MHARLPTLLRVKNVDAAQQPPERNARLYDSWSNIHALTGILFGLTFPALPAIVVMALWEPFEVFLLSPRLMKRGIVFGYEAWPNSVSDIVFDALGVAIGTLLAVHLGRPQDVLLLFR